LKKTIISSLLVALMIAGTSSFSAFATMSNGTVVIGNKSFELAYANDIANLTEITNEIIAGGTIYVKGFDGNWLNNTTGKTVEASVIPGEKEAVVIATVKTATFGAMVTVNSTQEGATKYQIVNGRIGLSGIANLGTETTIFPAKVVGDTVTINLLNAAGTIVATTDVTLVAPVVAPVTTDINFLDKNLEKAVRDIINKPTGNILKSDVDNITELNLKGASITNISGIENLTNLTILRIYDNQITNIEPLRNLTKLTILNLENNQISNIESLKGLTNLTNLSLSNNKLENIEPLSTLTNLTYLSLGQNQIVDYTPASSYYSNLILPDFQLSSGLQDYLTKNFSELKTNIGTAQFTFTILENNSSYSAYDYWIQVGYDYNYFENAVSSIKYTDEQKNVLSQELKDFQQKIANAAIAKMPSKKFYGGYYKSFYKYPNLQLELVTLYHNTWQNYNDNTGTNYDVTRAYQNARLSTFKWGQ